jgi:hypothetical protein
MYEYECIINTSLNKYLKVIIWNSIKSQVKRSYGQWLNYVKPRLRYLNV